MLRWPWMCLFTYPAAVALKSSVPKTAGLFSATWREHASGGHKLQLTIHGVVAGIGLLAEAAAQGEALWLGHKRGSTGETLVAGKAALCGTAPQMSALQLKQLWMGWRTHLWAKWRTLQMCKHKTPSTFAGTWANNWTRNLSLTSPIHRHVDNRDYVQVTLLEKNVHTRVIR